MLTAAPIGIAETFVNVTAIPGTNGDVFKNVTAVPTEEVYGVVNPAPMVTNVFPTEATGTYVSAIPTADPTLIELPIATPISVNEAPTLVEFTKITVLPCDVWKPIVEDKDVPREVNAAPMLIAGTNVPEEPKVSPIPTIGIFVKLTPDPIDMELPIDMLPVSVKNIVWNPTGTVSLIVVLTKTTLEKYFDADIVESPILNLEY